MMQCILFVVTYRCRTGSRSMSNLSIGSRLGHFTMKSCARSLHPCSCIGITTSQNIVMRRKCSSCSVSEDPSSVESSNDDLHTRQISFEVYTWNCKSSRFLCSKVINHLHVMFLLRLSISTHQLYFIEWNAYLVDES